MTTDGTAGLGNSEPSAEAGETDTPESLEESIPEGVYSYDGPLVEAIQLSKADLNTLLGGTTAEAPTTDSLELDNGRDAEYSHKTVRSHDGPVVGDAAVPLMGFTYSSLMPNGDIVEGAIQIPASHDGYTTHGQLKNYQQLAAAVADIMLQYTMDMSMRMNLVRAEEAAGDLSCDR